MTAEKWRLNVWFAELIAPDGTKETLDRGEHYR